MLHCSACYQALIWFLVAGIVASQTDGDGSAPEEICPCQAEDTCEDPRHIFGRDPLDIQKFGLISPCKTNGEMPCCPQEPPPPKEVKLTAKDFEGFSQAELVELGVLNNTIGSASLPLAPQMALFNEIPPSWKVPVNLQQPGAKSLPPAGATLPEASLEDQAALSQARQQGQIPAQASPTSHPPKQILRPAAYQPPVYRPPPPSPYRPAYQPPAYTPSPAYRPMYQAPAYSATYPPTMHPQPYYPRPIYQPPYRPPPPHPYYRM